MQKKIGWLIGGAAGALVGVGTFIILKQRTGDPFDTVNDIRNQYAKEAVSETEIEAENMVAEGAMTSVKYENEKQAK
ncbi:hypothetical protein [Listeria costaricensis]|uniref:hypothetical protein n=1 Tax=Listeria costaricensis TaxID=2026604 RepID=UPI000C08BFA9|nr:hypothetical protein [Listeria costaricensis]